MKKRNNWRFIFILMAIITAGALQQKALAQCSICTMTAQQMGEKPAKGMNSGIIYLMIAPIAIMGVIGYKWVRNERMHAKNTNS